MGAVLYYVVVLIVALVVVRATAPKVPEPEPPELGDIEVPKAEEGVALPVAFGTVWVKSPNVVWYGALTVRPIRKSAGKK